MSVFDQGRPDAVGDGCVDPGTGRVSVLLDQHHVARVETWNARKLLDLQLKCLKSKTIIFLYFVFF